MHDEHIHMNNKPDKEFPEPDVPVEDGWSRMRTILDYEMRDGSKSDQSIPQSGIEAGSKQGIVKIKSPRFIYRMAASVAFLITAGAIIYFMLYRHFFLKPETRWATFDSGKEILKKQLPDGSNVVLNRNSSILYPSEFDSQSRKIKLSGEAYFDIQHNPGKPFIIDLNILSIKVLGTAFNVKSDNKDQTIEVRVIRGSVMMYDQLNKIIIHDGWRGVYNKQSGKFSLDSLSDQNSVAYATGILNFKDRSLGEICKNLELAFGVKIQFQNRNLANCYLSSRFENKSVLFIMDVISATFDISYKVNGNEIYISGKGCP
jgi:transmembrane sensor